MIVESSMSWSSPFSVDCDPTAPSALASITTGYRLLTTPNKKMEDIFADEEEDESESPFPPDDDDDFSGFDSE